MSETISATPTRVWSFRYFPRWPWPLSKKVRFLIDGDLLTFAAASATQDDIHWNHEAGDSEEQIWTTFVNLDAAMSKFKADLSKLVSDGTKAMQGGPDEVMFCLTGPNNFRKKVLPTYKSNRGRKPSGYAHFLEMVQEYVEGLEGYTFFRRDGLEADDCLGILGTHQLTKYRPIIWSRDKDLRMVPCEHYVDGEIVGAEDGWEMRHPLQTLTGDTVDGYKGLPGCGPVAAKKVLAGDPETVWERVEAAYLKKGLTRDDMLVQARVARILTAADYDFKTGKPILWEPPEPVKTGNDL